VGICLFVEETEVFSENNQPVTRNVQMLSETLAYVSTQVTIRRQIKQKTL